MMKLRKGTGSYLFVPAGARINEKQVTQKFTSEKLEKISTNKSNKKIHVIKHQNINHQTHGC